jgi:hypothetical protein
LVVTAGHTVAALQVVQILVGLVQKVVVLAVAALFVSFGLVEPVAPHRSLLQT